MDEPFTDENAQRLDLRLENQRLAAEVRTRGGLFETNPQLDPAVENAFLKRVLAFDDMEKQPEVPIRTWFPELDRLPRVEAMDEVQLVYHLDGIKRVLAEHGMLVELVADVPPEVEYRFLVEDYIPTTTVPDMGDVAGTWNVDGCDGWCQGCFQRSYCEPSEEPDVEIPGGTA